MSYRRLSLALCALLLPALLCATTPAYTTPAQAAPAAVALSEEPNEDWSAPYALPGAGSYNATLATATDLDWFRLPAVPSGTTIAATLRDLPADYDLVLAAEPLAVTSVDEQGLGAVQDIGGRISAIGGRISAIGGRISAIGGRISAIGGRISAISAEPGTANEQVQTIHWQGDQPQNFYLLVLGANGASSSLPYTLDVQLNAGLIANAQPLTSSYRNPSSTDPTLVRTLYVANWARMLALGYPEADVSTLQTRAAQFAQRNNGVVLDLSADITSEPAAPVVQLCAERSKQRPEEQLPYTLTVTPSLQARYDVWDCNLHNPLAANSVAVSIKAVIASARQLYTNVDALVLLGGDPVVPFYRVIDETTLANEFDYRGAVSTGAYSATVGALDNRAILTDDFYVDDDPIPWRGRALFLPDLPIGRLVETPAEIINYLGTYEPGSSTGTPDVFTINASQRGAFVSGYDFLTDQAQEVANTLQEATGRVSQLIGADWSRSEFEQAWLPNLSEFVDGYNAGNGVESNYSLMSLNAHFDHDLAIPALYGSELFPATRILTPSVDSNHLKKTYFRQTLCYSVGCHSGLNVPHDPGNLAESPLSRPDFPQAAIKHGGNWIGNTGYGYGDADLVGYSERLSLLFTQEIAASASSCATSPPAVYEGVRIGDALICAKQRYVLGSGPGGFGVFDEKALIETTLYGLPFIRVQVPTPLTIAQSPAPAFARAAVIAQPGGIFTRTVTIEGAFAADDAAGSGNVPRFTATLVQDSLLPSAPLPASAAQSAAYLPALPQLTYDLTLAPGCVPGPSCPQQPEVRAVALTNAAFGDQNGFNPLISRLITQGVDLDPLTLSSEPPYNPGGRWFPAQPYGHTRVETASGHQDGLVLNPAQYLPQSVGTGTLRRYTRFTFAITYITPGQVPAPIEADLKPPLVVDTQAVATQVGQVYEVRISSLVRDEGGVAEVWALYTSDGQSWNRAPMRAEGQDRYAVSLPLPLNGAGMLFAVQALDQAGNLTVDDGKGSFYPPVGAPDVRLIYLPLIHR